MKISEMVMFLKNIEEEMGDIEVAFINDDGNGEYIIDFPEIVSLMSVPTEDGFGEEIVAGILSTMLTEEFEAMAEQDPTFERKLKLVKGDDDDGSKGFLN